MTPSRPTATSVVILATALLTFGTAASSLVISFQTKAAVQDVHIILNSRLTELLDVTKKAAHAAGVKEGEEGTKP